MITSGIRVKAKDDDDDTPAIDSITEQMIVDYLVKYHGNYTLAEIMKAFFLNSIGKLEKRVEHFQLFDTTFVSKVMEEWLIVKNKTRQRMSALLPPKVEKLPTAEESYQGLIANCQKNGLFPEYWSWQQVYDHMMNKGLIPETKEQRWNLYYQELDKLTSKLELDTLSLKLSVSEMNKRREQLPIEAKAICVKTLVQKNLNWK